MPFEEEESIPSEKMKDIENERFVVEPKKKETDISPILEEPNTRFHLYMYISEGVLFLFTLLSFAFALAEMTFFFDIIQNGSYYYLNLKLWSLILIIPIAAFAIINTYFFIFRLQPKHRTYTFLLRFGTITIIVTSFIFSLIATGYSYDLTELILVFVVLLYSTISQFVLKVFLLSNDKPINLTLFRKAIAGSPSELEWRKFDSISGFLALLSGVFFLQAFWIIYHLIIRKQLITIAKRRLIIEKLDYDKEVNLQTVALDVGIALEEVIFILKQLSLKRKIIVEFTRYGAILKEIRYPKLFTLAMQEKYDVFLGQKKLSEIELKANKFIELAERERLSEEDLKKVMDFKDDLKIEDLILLLPHRVIEIKRVAFSKKRWIQFNLEHTLLKRERIVKALVENATKIFN